MFLVTRPTHDITTHYLSAWSEEVLRLAQSKGKQIVDLHHDKATGAKVQSYLKKTPVKMIMFNGHGSPASVLGHKDDPLITTPRNEILLRQKIVYCRSCESAKKLGPDSIISGASAFVGYNDVFIFLYDEQLNHRPLNDVTAERFLKPGNVLVQSLLKGNTVKEAVKRSQECFNKSIMELLASNVPTEERELVRYLLWDKDHEICHGDLKAQY